MSAVDLTLLLKAFPSPVVTTSEVAALMRGRVDSANKMLGRLTTKGVVKPLARGLWALGSDLDPNVLSRYLAAPSPSYVSLLSALRFHGMISQIPRSTYVVSLGRPQEIETSLGDFSIHTMAPEVFGGFVATPRRCAHRLTGEGPLRRVLPVRDEAAHLLVAAGGRTARPLRLREGEGLDAQGSVEAPPDDRGTQDVRAGIGLVASRSPAALGGGPASGQVPSAAYGRLVEFPAGCREVGQRRSKTSPPKEFVAFADQLPRTPFEGPDLMMGRRAANETDCPK